MSTAQLFPMISDASGPSFEHQSSLQKPMATSGADAAMSTPKLAYIRTVDLLGNTPTDHATRTPRGKRCRIEGSLIFPILRGFT